MEKEWKNTPLFPSSSIITVERVDRSLVERSVNSK